MQSILKWSPRILAIGVALFFAVFALDVFGEYPSANETLVALAMHLVPAIILLVATVVAWRDRLIGGVLFLAAGALSVVFFDTNKHPITFLLISLPLFATGSLFWFAAWYDQQTRAFL
ncbi:MAG: hypothetical protein AAFV33_10305 [Chloroflexota bacterium]